MFGQVLEKLDSWIGRSFLLARFFPWLLFAAANLGLAAIEFPWAREFVTSEYGRLGSDRAVDVVVALIAIAVVAYTVSPATRWAIRILEGRGLPWVLVAPWLLRRRYEVDEAARKGLKTFRARARLPDQEAMSQRLSTARAIGQATHTVTDPKSIVAAHQAIMTLRMVRQIGRPIPATQLRIAIEILREALMRNCADAFELKSGVSSETIRQSGELDELHTEMAEVLLPYATDIAQRREAYLNETQQKLYAAAELAPTRLGNDVAALRSYCDTRYGFDFDFFWPRLQLVVKDQKLLDKLAAANIQVEFSALSLCLSAILTASWLLILFVAGHTVTALALVAIGGPVLIQLWLWMVHQSYAALADLIQATIDLARFDLLRALNRPLPATLVQEKAAWNELAFLLRLNDADVAKQFSYPPS